MPLGDVISRASSREDFKQEASLGVAQIRAII
jgi:hypothetical protein